MLDLTDWQNKKYTTRDGRPVRLLCVDAVGDWPIIGTIIDKLISGGVREYPYVWRLDGSREVHEYKDGLINAKTKKEGWVKIKSDPSGIRAIAFTSHIYAIEEDADNARDSGVVIKIEWEE